MGPLAAGDSTLRATGHVQLLGGGSGRSSRLFVGERLDCPAGPGLRAVQDRRCLVGQGEGELVAIGGSRGVVGLELGGFTLEGGVQGRELRHGFLGQGEALRVNFDAERLLPLQGI